MFNRVIVGIDGRQGGRDAIALAEELLAPDGELTLAHIYPGDPHVYRSTSPAYDASEHERALALMRKAGEEAHLHAPVRARGSSSVGRGLHELCEQVQADLLVLGSSRHGLLGRVLIGDDTRSSLNGAPCAVAIAPGGFASEPSAMREIGVGYDGSPESEHAVRVARELAAESGAKLSAFQAVSLPMMMYAPGPVPLGDTIQGLIDDARDRITTLGGVEPHAAYGPAAEELALYSASLDLLVLGSRGYGPLGRLIHGSTSCELARAARCPLLVLPRGARPVDEDERGADEAEVALSVDG